jgi:transcriptional regulator with XRE-family HTH domain
VVLKKYRVASGYSQVELANLCEMETKELVSFEQGLIDDAPQDTLRIITRQLNVSLVEFTKEVEELQTEVGK